MIIRLAWNKRQRELATVALVPWKTRPLRGRPENSLSEFSRLRAPLTTRQQRAFVPCEVGVALGRSRRAASGAFRRTAAAKRRAGFGALGWVSLLAMSLALSPTAGAQDEDQQPASGATTETSLPSESEPGPDEGVEQESESSASTAPTEAVDESNDGDDTDRGDESGPPEGEPAAEVFVPTEEISEDFAVPFPVDI